MTDKQIIIDDVDITKCEYHSKLLEGVCTFYGRCAKTFCPYKAKWLKEQLLRKEQECEELKEKFQDMKKSRDVALKEYNEEFEYKRQITVEHLEQKKELLKQLDQLKAENEDLKNGYSKLNSLYNDNCDYTDKLEKTITEIKETAEKLKNFYEELGKCEDLTVVRLKQILQKISECEGQ